MQAGTKTENLWQAKSAAHWKAVGLVVEPSAIRRCDFCSNPSDKAMREVTLPIRQLMCRHPSNFPEDDLGEIAGRIHGRKRGLS